MPDVRANWYKPMSIPRDCGGASSETYTGAVTEVKPTATPSSARATNSTYDVGG